MTAYSRYIQIAILSAMATFFVVQLTPLRWLQIAEPRIHDIDPKEFRSQYVANPEHYVFIDVRPESVYKQLHAQGAISMPLNTLFNERRTLPKSGKEIVLICSGGTASGVGYFFLQHFGFTNIQRIEGGIEEWGIQGLPVEGSSLGT